MNLSYAKHQSDKGDFTSGDFMVRTLHLDAIAEGGVDMIIGADEQYLYLCDWPYSKRHNQNLKRIGLKLGLNSDLGKGANPILPYSFGENQILDKTVEQLNRYFRGELREFNLPIKALGSDFQNMVWKQLCSVPYGNTVTYGEIARMMGLKAGFQAVGMAVGANPISIIIPCHRVVAQNGLGGYAGGLSLKSAFLAFEDSHK